MGELRNGFPRGQLSTITPLPPIQGRNKKIKPYLTVYSTQLNLGWIFQGLPRFYSARGKGLRSQKRKGGKRFVKCGQAREENSSHGMSFLPPQTLFMKSELLHPQHMEPGYKTDGKWENFKPFPDFSSVFSPFTSRAPAWTGANISFTLGPCFPGLVPWSSEGLHASRRLKRSSSWSLCLRATQCLAVKDCILCFGILYDSPLVICFKVEPLHFQNVFYWESIIQNKHWLLFLPHAFLFLLFCPMWQAGHGGYLYNTKIGALNSWSAHLDWSSWLRSHRSLMTYPRSSSFHYIRWPLENS